MARLPVNPTRVELRRLKARLKTASRGHKLLKDKSDEMIRQFLVIIRECKALREAVDAETAEALRAFMLAGASSSEQILETALALPSRKVRIETGERNVMGVYVPSVTVTAHCAVKPLSSVVTVIVAMPVVWAVTRPSFTEATAGVFDDHNTF